MAPTEISLRGITKSFMHSVKGKVMAVDNVTIEVQQGELLTLLGPSGCGKSTTLRIIAGFEQPDQGRVVLGGNDITDLMTNRRNIGFVFQNYALFPHLNVFENVAYGLKVKRLRPAEIRESVAETLELVGLWGYERQFPSQMSGGEQQRVALARAIVIKPKILLFDEPLSNLDAKLRVRMRGEIRRVQRSLGITSIYVTHDQEEAMAISDRIAVMNAGVIEQVGSAEELYFAPKSEFVAGFIGKVNIIEATLRSTDSDSATVEVFGHRYRAPLPEVSMQPGERVRVFIRPQFIRLFPDIERGGFRARIKERTFLGEKVEYLVEVGDAQLTVVGSDSTDRGLYQPGKEVGVILQEANMRLLKT